QVVALAPGAALAAQGQAWITMLAGLLAIVGHSKSVWIGFTGGKSAASGLGVLLGLTWPVALGAAMDLLPPEIRVFGVEPLEIDWEVGLSAPLAAVVPEVAAAIAAYLTHDAAKEAASH
ncbi:MAG: hypothetical protein HC915_08270, partial [Anaerolineae bacterium]|nr:hypothetical protein [Anaerolineae bacterium]